MRNKNKIVWYELLSCATPPKIYIVGRLSIFFFVIASILFINTTYAFDWFVRPAGEEYGAEDGTSYENAWAGLLSVEWGERGVQPGDTLYVCGLHIYEMRNNDHRSTQADIHVTGGTGESERVIIRGDYSIESGTVWGGYIRNYGIKYGVDKIWQREADLPNVWSTTLDTSLYGDWLFEQDFTSASFVVLEKADSIESVAYTPGSHYSANYQSGTKIYVQCSDSGDPTGRILFNRYGYHFRVGSNSFITFKNITFNAPAPFWFGADLPSHISVEGCRFFYGEARMFGITDGMDYMKITDCELAWAGNGIYTMSKSDANAPSYYNFSRNYIHDMGVREIQQNGDAHAIGIQGGHDGVILGNRCVNCGTGPLLYAFTNQEMKDNLVAYNYVKDCHTLGDATSYGISTMCNNDSLSDKTGNKFYGNVVENCKVGYRFQFEDMQDVYGNVAYECGIGLAASRTYNDYGPNVKAMNNFFYDSELCHIYFGTGGALSKGDFDYNKYFPDGAGKFALGSRKQDHFSGWQANQRPGYKFDPNSRVVNFQISRDADGFLEFPLIPVFSSSHTPISE